MPPAPNTLPVVSARDEILAALEGPGASGALILSAPPGTGKSTQVPRWLARGEGLVLVLQPRRIAARALAARVAEEHGDALGETVGYQVRFESAHGPRTRLLFMTYGMFRQRIARDPDLAGVRAVVLDEFHERAWEADFALLWCRALRADRRPDLRVVVMSATLDASGLGAYLPDARPVAVEGRAFPVDIRHQPPGLSEPLPQQVLRALKALRAGLDGSVLVFLPGGGEIKWCGDHLASYCRQAGLRLRELHGSMPLAAQQDTLRSPDREATVILATNVAETSLTVPGVTGVIDAGLHRVSAYDAERDLNTLYLQPVSLANATQRAGRAGRVAPGVCVRLWDAAREAVMAAHLDPEIRRMELSGPALAWHALPATGDAENASRAARLPWPTPPDPETWERAERKLARLGAIADSRITPRGRSLLDWPADPVLARVLQDAADDAPPVRRLVAAMAAVLSAGRRGPSSSSGGDLFRLGEDLAAQHAPDGRVDRETLGAFRQFLGLLDRKAARGKTAAAPPPDDDALRARAGRLFLPVYVDRLGARAEGAQAFTLGDGRKGLATVPAAVRLVLALEVHESGGKDRARQTTFPLVLPLEAAWVEREYPGECAWEDAETFDEKKGQLRREQRLMFRGLVIDRREKQLARGADASDTLLEKLRTGEVELPFDDASRQWIHRIRLAHRVCPESGVPELGDEDWELIWHEAVAGKKSLKQLREVDVTALLKEYLGYSLASFLEREAPVSARLPGPRRGKITYFEKTPPELSARLGDFVGMQGRFKILMGRQDVTYDILAPNYRTVQKTSDLTAFWSGSYLEIKKELKRRYPRHPWP